MPNVPGTSNYPDSLDTAVSLIEAANDAVTSLTQPLTANATVANVSDTTTFANSGSVTIEGEGCFYTGKTQSTLTGLVRGVEGTTAAAHQAGVSVEGLITARHHNVLVDTTLALQSKVGTGAATPGAGTFLKGIGSGQSTWAALTAADIALFEEYRLLRVAKIEYGDLPPSATMVLADLSGGPGSVESIQLAVSAVGNATGQEKSKVNNDSLLKLTIDGVVVGTFDLGTFFLWHGLGEQPSNSGWITDDFAVTMRGNAAAFGGYPEYSCGGFRRIFIPYNSTLKWELINSSTSAAGVIFTQVNYRTGTPPFTLTGTRRKRFFCAVTPLTTTLATYASLDLINVSGRGQIEGIHVFMYAAAPEPSWLEGNPTLLIDGQTLSYGGMEDFFGSQYYGLQSLGLTTESWGIPQNGMFSTNNYAQRLWGTGMYRLFRKDPLIFNSGCKLTIFNGQAGQAGTPPAVSVSAIVFGHMDS